MKQKYDQNGRIRNSENKSDIVRIGRLTKKLLKHFFILYNLNLNIFYRKIEKKKIMNKNGTKKLSMQTF